jgi:Putative peptidoglycan binding domain
VPPVSSRDPQASDPQSSDQDDWFAEPGPGAPPPVERRRQVEAGAYGGDRRAGPAGRFPALGDVRPRTVIAAAAVLVVVVLAGLAAAGVFSSSGAHHATGVTTPPAPATTARMTTTTTRRRGTTTTATRPAGGGVPTATLKPGDTGAQVKLLQRALTRLGYSPGSADGDYGPSTEAAVKRFQEASKLTADGVAGPATLAALRRALRASR